MDVVRIQTWLSPDESALPRTLLVCCSVVDVEPSGEAVVARNKLRDEAETRYLSGQRAGGTLEQGVGDVLRGLRRSDSLDCYFTDRARAGTVVARQFETWDYSKIKGTSYT